MKEEKGIDVLLTLIGCNIVPIALIALSGWFAYLDNGYWGWPFVLALLTGKSIMSTKDKLEMERKERIEKAKEVSKYGNIMDN